MPGPYLNYLLRHPIGVCGLLTPFNHPLMILAKSLAPALATGNRVVVEALRADAADDPRARAASPPRRGSRDGVLNVVTGAGGERRQGAGRASRRRQGDVHRRHRRRALDRRGRGASASRGSTTELGGKTPGARLRRRGRRARVKGVAFGAFVAAGQTCICGARILVQSAIYDEFVAGLAEIAGTIRIGDPSDEATQTGSGDLREAARDACSATSSSAQEEGGRLVTGGGRPELPGLRRRLLRRADRARRRHQRHARRPGGDLRAGRRRRSVRRRGGRAAQGERRALRPRLGDLDARRRPRAPRGRAHRGRDRRGSTTTTASTRPPPGAASRTAARAARAAGSRSTSSPRSTRSSVRTADDDVDWYGDDAPTRLN